MSLEGPGRGRGLLLPARRTARSGSCARCPRGRCAVAWGLRAGGTPPTMGLWKCPREAKDRLAWR
jgi:hypothetical protein